MQPNLTRAQLTQLVEEFEKLRDWTIYRDFCDQVYGEGVVAELTLETYAESDDEGGAYYRIEGIYARSATGEDLDFDLALPFWQEILDRPDVFPAGIDDGEKQDIARQELMDWDATQGTTWMEWRDLSSNLHGHIQHPIYLLNAPKVSFLVQPI